MLRFLTFIQRFLTKILLFSSISGLQSLKKNISITGAMFFFGGNNSHLAGEFVAVELEGGRPRLVLNFGTEDSASVTLESDVSDKHWRELVVERIGNRASIRVTQPAGNGGTDGQQVAEEQTIIAPGAKSVLNLFDDSRRLFIGGPPPGFKVLYLLAHIYFVKNIIKS